MQGQVYRPETATEQAAAASWPQQLEDFRREREQDRQQAASQGGRR